MRFSDIVAEWLSLAENGQRKAILGRYLIVSRVVHGCVELLVLIRKENFKIGIFLEKQKIVCKMASLDGGRFCGYF